MTDKICDRMMQQQQHVLVFEVCSQVCQIFFQVLEQFCVPSEIESCLQQNVILHPDYIVPHTYFQ
jgi:hypothetical protein